MKAGKFSLAYPTAGFAALLFVLATMWYAASSQNSAVIYLLLFALAAVFQILPWPWTLLVIMPTNRALLALKPSEAGPQSRALLEKWGRLHAMRTLLGCAATLAFLAACLTGAPFGPGV